MRTRALFDGILVASAVAAALSAVTPVWTSWRRARTPDRLALSRLTAERWQALAAASGASAETTRPALVLVTDPQCHACRYLYLNARTMSRRYPDMSVGVLLLPRNDPISRSVALRAACAELAGRLDEFLDWAFEEQDRIAQDRAGMDHRWTCDERAAGAILEAHREAAAAADLVRAPAIVVNGQALNGVIGLARLDSAIVRPYDPAR